MAMEEKRGTRQVLHMEDRERISITGVEDVTGFDEDGMVIETLLGTLLIGGSGLRIQKYNVESGELTVEGEIDELTYSDAQQSKKGLLGRLFG